MKPNIVFILTDNLGYGELGCYGGGELRGAPTPRADKLASEGMRLTNFNVEAQCTPSRSAIMTGRYAMRSGTLTVPIGNPAVGDHARQGLVGWELTIATRSPSSATRPPTSASGTSAASTAGCPTTTASTNGGGYRARPTKCSGPRAPASTSRVSSRSTSWKAARARRPARSQSTTSNSGRCWMRRSRAAPSTS